MTTQEGRQAELIFGIPLVFISGIVGTPIVVKAAGLPMFLVWLVYIGLAGLAVAGIVSWIRKTSPK